MAFKLSKATKDKLDAARIALDEAREEMQEEFDSRSDSWREGDKGLAVETWLEEMANLVDEIDALDDAPQEA